jgi:hypothetical protein
VGTSYLKEAATQSWGPPQAWLGLQSVSQNSGEALKDLKSISTGGKMGRSVLEMTLSSMPSLMPCPNPMSCNRLLKK